MTATFDRRTRGLAALTAALLFALAGPDGGPGPAAAAPGANEVTLFLGRDFSSPSRSWELPEGQPFLAVPHIGRDYAGIMGGARVGAEVGVVLFEGPFFQAADRTCDYRLGAAEAPDLWWRSARTRVLPAGAEQGVVEADVSATPAASLIVFRRALGPPPGALLLERARTIDWDCDRPTKARSYKRLFVPVPQAPNTQGCFNMAASLSSPELGQASLDFTAASELALLLPADAGGRFRAVEHRLSATLYDAENCEGASVAVAHPRSGGRHFDLRDLGFDRKTRSLLLSYDGGAYDDYLPPPDQRPEAPAAEIVKAPAPAAESAAPQEAPAADEPSRSLTASLAEQEGAAPAAAQPDPEPDAEAAAPAQPAPEPDPEPTSEPSESLAATLAEQEGAVAGEDPEALQAGLVMPAEGAPEATAASRTFRYPLLQGYRLNACKSGRRDCGEPAASTWCRGQGFRRAADWKIDENVGSLFPTLAIGDLQLCADFVCDSFEEITCVQ